MSDTGQLSLQRRSHLFGGGVFRRMHWHKPTRMSCMTLYAMHLASGVPVEMEPGVCPVCGAHDCKLVRTLERRTAGS
jgi:hypothetical protein